MNKKEYIVGERTFRTESDYKRALRDEELIKKLREESRGFSREKLERLKEDLQSGKYPFYTLLGDDFQDEISARIKEAADEKDPRQRKKPLSDRELSARSKVTDQDVENILKKQERLRGIIVAACAAVAVFCMAYLLVYSYHAKRTQDSYDALNSMKNSESKAKDPSDPAHASKEPEPVVIHYTDDEVVVPEVLDEYKNLLIKNKKLIGWVKIDDTNIDYPVMQTTDNEYYLDHNLNQEYDKNGSIFMDKDCDVIKPSMNLILYGHHMKSGKMFGYLHKYEDRSYYEKHRYIDFDTIYEKGIYEVMYVFRSRVYSEEDVVFKYYQFIDAMSELEFNSYMKEMAADSLYDTGVTAGYGDRLLTLSTCDYQETNGRFVVVAKKVSKKE